MPGRGLSDLQTAVDGLLSGQGDATRGCLLALLAREHVLLEGPPGCGKSALVGAVGPLVGARSVGMALHRESRASELLGPSVLRRDRTALGERLTFAPERGPLHAAELLVLDDLSRASMAVLVPILRVLSERRLGGRPLPLESALATAAAPTADAAPDPLPPSMLDRFAVQVRLRGLLTSGHSAAARRIWAPPPPAAFAIDTSLRHLLQARAAGLGMPDEVREALIGLLGRIAGLRAPDGSVALSDRLLGMAAAMMRAHALLRSAPCVAVEDLAVLRLMLGRRIPEGLLPLALALVAEAAEARGAAAPPPGRMASQGEGRPEGLAETQVGNPNDADESPEATPGSEAFPRRPKRAASVGALLRALEGRIDSGQVAAASDPGGAPRRQARLVRLDELEDADVLEALLFLDGCLPGSPRVLRRERRHAAGALAVLRDVSASMAGAPARAAAEVVAGLVRLAARRRMRLGYIEFHHAAESFPAEGAFLHRRHGRLLSLAARVRAEGRTSYEAPLQLALGALANAGGGPRHVVLLTDGVPVVGDPLVVRERALARRLGIRIHTIFLGGGEPPAVLERISGDTGGQEFQLSLPADGPRQVQPRGAA